MPEAAVQKVTGTETATEVGEPWAGDVTPASVTGSRGHGRRSRPCRVNGALDPEFLGDDQIRIAGTFGRLSDT